MHAYMYACCTYLCSHSLNTHTCVPYPQAKHAAHDEVKDPASVTYVCIHIHTHILCTQAKHAADDEVEDPAAVIQVLLNKQALMHADSSVRMSGMYVMYVHVCICMHMVFSMQTALCVCQVCMYVCMYMCICMHMVLSMRISLCVRQVCMYVCMYMCVYVCIWYSACRYLCA